MKDECGCVVDGPCGEDSMCGAYTDRDGCKYPAVKGRLSEAEDLLRLFVDYGYLREKAVAFLEK